LARARVFAREQVSTTNFHSIWLPNLSDKPYFYDTTLLAVPVVPSLETIATHMIASPNDFASTNADAVVVPESASGLRGCGVEALQYFKSPKNIELLESLLNDDDPARFEAYEVLKGWGIKVPKPEP